MFCRAITKFRSFNSVTKCRSFSSVQTLEASRSAIENAIAENDLTLFSKTWCGFCGQAKSIYNEIDLQGSKIAVYELDEMENGTEIQAILADMTGQRTVPSSFVKGKHIGGCDDVSRLYASGELEKLFSNSNEAKI
eukprot:g3894.t1